MFYLTDCSIAMDLNECPTDLNFIDFDLDKNYNIPNNYALKIDFHNDISYSIKCIKKLIVLHNNNINFVTPYKNLELNYIISNYNEEIIYALKAIFINNTLDKYNYVYDSICDILDSIWKETNPCKFCNNRCIASINNQTAHIEDGCCYSFEYSHNPFSLSFIKNVQRCQHLDRKIGCTTKNIACKLFVCKYLQKNQKFNLSANDIILLQCFFSKKQQLILRYNFFKTKEEIINKLTQKNNLPYFLYYLTNSYRI